MYAIIQTGSKQYTVKEGDVIEIEKLDKNQGQVEFKEILLFHDGQTAHIGAPYVPCLVQGNILKEVKGDKVIFFKYKRRKNYHRKGGHRQKYTQVKITTIQATKDHQDGS